MVLLFQLNSIREWGVSTISLTMNLTKVISSIISMWPNVASLSLYLKMYSEFRLSKARNRIIILSNLKPNLLWRPMWATAAQSPSIDFWISLGQTIIKCKKCVKNLWSKTSRCSRSNNLATDNRAANNLAMVVVKTKWPWLTLWMD